MPIINPPSSRAFTRATAAFWLAAGAALPGSEVAVEHVGLNPTRTGILDVLRRMGAEIKTVLEHAQAGEPMGVITVSHGGLQPITKIGRAHV